jgi:twinkle protein
MLRELTEEQAERIAARAISVIQANGGVMTAFKAPSDYAGQTSAEIANPPEKTGCRLPWEKTHEQMRLRPSEVSVWAGANGSWKTMVLSQVAIDLAMRQRQVVVFASLEMTPSKQLRRIVRQATCVQDPSESTVSDFLEDLGEYFTLYQHEAHTTIPQALQAMQHAAEDLGVQHFFLDNISCVIPLGRESDQQAQNFIQRCAELSRRTGMHIHLVAHIRKPAEDRPPNRYEIRGTGSISDLVDNVVMFWRNRKKEEEDGKAEDPDLILTVDKQRHGDWEGRWGLWMDRRNLRFVGSGIEPVIPYWERR